MAEVVGSMNVQTAQAQSNYCAGAISLCLMDDRTCTWPSNCSSSIKLLCWSISLCLMDDRTCTLTFVHKRTLLLYSQRSTFLTDALRSEYLLETWSRKSWQMHAQRWSCYCGDATGKTGRQSFITQSVACGNDDLDTAAATKYRDPKTMRGYVTACSPRRLAESVWLWNERENKDVILLELQKRTIQVLE